MGGARNYVFTDFGLSDYHLDNGDIIKYICWGWEVCPDTGRPHHQGYVEFRRPQTYLQANKLLDTKANYQKREGTREEARNYTWKGQFETKRTRVPQPSAIWLELGDFTVSQGCRTDMREARGILQDTSSMGLVMEECFSYQVNKNCELYLKYRESKRAIQPINVVWCWGQSGTGKTRWVYESFDDVFKPVSFKWWEGYDGQITVLIDDFRRDFCKFHELISPLTDIYPFRVETKGGSRQVQFKNIIFTCPYHWREVYDTREDLFQLERRITETKYFERACEIESEDEDRDEVGTRDDDQGNNRPGHLGVGRSIKEFFFPAGQAY